MTHHWRPLLFVVAAQIGLVSLGLAIQGSDDLADSPFTIFLYVLAAFLCLFWLAVASSGAGIDALDRGEGVRVRWHVTAEEWTAFMACNRLPDPLSEAWVQAMEAGNQVIPLTGILVTMTADALRVGGATTTMTSRNDTRFDFTSEILGTEPPMLILHWHATRLKHAWMSRSLRIPMGVAGTPYANRIMEYLDPPA